MRDAGRLSPLPVRLEARVAVAALGRLDSRELDAAVGDRVPINIALELGHVDAVDRVVLRLEMAARKDVAREDRVRIPGGRRRNPRPARPSQAPHSQWAEKPAA